jgi:hypothetical protein
MIEAALRGVAASFVPLQESVKTAGSRHNSPAARRERIKRNTLDAACRMCGDVFTRSI